MKRLHKRRVGGDSQKGSEVRIHAPHEDSCLQIAELILRDLDIFPGKPDSNRTNTRRGPLECVLPDALSSPRVNRINDSLLMQDYESTIANQSGRDKNVPPGSRAGWSGRPILEMDSHTPGHMLALSRRERRAPVCGRVICRPFRWPAFRKGVGGLSHEIRLPFRRWLCMNMGEVYERT
jgi:hypothetical protein